MTRQPDPLTPPRTAAYIRLVRSSAWYDLVVTAGFATPWTYALLHGALSSLSTRFGLGTLPALNPFQTLYANLMGSVVIVWALLRIIRPLPLHGLLDGIARTLFASWQTYALAHGATRVLWFFFVLEATFGVVQLLPWWRDRAALLASVRRNDPEPTTP
ncbi:hypothetical protein ACFV1W_16780 [Kitasatospora sp. NPDC059648]|uniref:hypothetical protein n=1 Tax=Kitasatospora sp. NPDC059648 TaxID=3346894 RepID=UPI0036B60CBF